MKKLLMLITCAAATMSAATIQYTLSVPAVTTGPYLTNAFTMSFTVPQLLTTTTDVFPLGTVVAPTPIDAAHPVLLGVNVFPTAGDISVYAGGPPAPAEIIGSVLASGPFDHLGKYYVAWQVSSNPVFSDVVTGTLTIADVTSSNAPEPGSVWLIGAALAGVGWMRRAA